jgi:hypothetical protein
MYIYQHLKMTNLYSDSCVNLANQYSDICRTSMYPDMLCCIYFMLGMLFLLMFYTCMSTYEDEKLLRNNLKDEKLLSNNNLKKTFCVKLNIIKHKNISFENYEKHMTYIGIQLKKKFNCDTVHVLPYEITMIFLDNKHIFNSINNYILTNITSYATSLLTSCIINDIIMNENDKEKQKNILNKPCCFKGDLIMFENIETLTKFIFKRSQYYGYRNFVSRIALANFDKIEHINTDNRIKMLMEKNIDINSYPNSCKYGTFIKTFLNENNKNQICAFNIDPKNDYIFNKIISQYYCDNSDGMECYIQKV